MKPNLLFLVLLACCLCNVIHAQHYIPQSNYDLQLSNRLLIRTTPTNLISKYGSQLPIGIEYGFSRNWGLVFDVGIPLKSLMNDRHLKSYEYTYLLRSELRTYFGFSRNTKWYMALEGFTPATGLYGALQRYP